MSLWRPMTPAAICCRSLVRIVPLLATSLKSDWIVEAACDLLRSGEESYDTCSCE